MEHLQYVIEDSTIAYLLGVNNFTNDESAILELVKNSYDAGALHVNISFQEISLLLLTTDKEWTKIISERHGCMLEKAINLMKFLMQIIGSEFWPDQKALVVLPWHDSAIM